MARYSRTNIIKNTEGKRYYNSKIYPEIPRSDNDLYVITSFGDRYDLLANRYYKNSSLWWVISSANPEYIGSLYPPIGIQLRIPADISVATQI
jgi:hypothetical protein